MEYLDLSSLGLFGSIFGPRRDSAADSSLVIVSTYTKQLCTLDLPNPMLLSPNGI